MRRPQKTVIMETSRRPLPTPLSIKLAQDALTKVQSRRHRHLGVILSHDLRSLWSNHVDYILTKATRLLSVLRRLRSSLDQESLSHMYLTYIRPILEYACTAWGNLGTTQVDRLERFQRRAAKIILRRPLFAPSNHDELLATIGCLPWRQEGNTSAGRSGTSYGHQQRSPALERLHPFQAHPHAQH